MSVETIGIVIFLLGLVSLLVTPAFGIYVFICSTLLGSSAAIILTAMGGANIQPAHLMLLFLLISWIWNREFAPVNYALRFPKAGFWLLLTAVYGIVSVVVFPSLFSDSTFVFTTSRSPTGPGIVLMPLAPSAGNITQIIYFLGDLVCFLIFYNRASSPNGFIHITQALLMCAALNLIFAILDVVTFYTSTAESLAFIRNATYRMLDDAISVGFKRIVGSFPETSSFSSATLTLFAFTLRLCISGFYPRISLLLSMLLIVALIFSTSTTAYGGLAIYLSALYIFSVFRLVAQPVPRMTMMFILFLPVAGSALILSLMLDGTIWAAVTDIFDKVVFTKMATDSGIERSSWNAQALKNLFDSFGLGIGVGSTRASSFPLAVLANIGIIGALTYGLFLARVLFGDDRSNSIPFVVGAQSAARSACFALLISSVFAGAFIDLGLVFFILAALACAEPNATATTAIMPSKKSRKKSQIIHA